MQRCPDRERRGRGSARKSAERRCLSTGWHRPGRRCVKDRTMYEGNSNDFGLPPRNTTFSRSQEPSVATVYTNNSRNIGLPSVPPIVNTSASLSSSSFAKKSAGNAELHLQHLQEGPEFPPIRLPALLRQGLIDGGVQTAAGAPLRLLQCQRGERHRQGACLQLLPCRYDREIVPVGS